MNHVTKLKHALTSVSIHQQTSHMKHMENESKVMLALN